MTNTSLSILAPHASGNLVRLLGQALAVLARWFSQARQARQLASLDDRLLADIGLSREAVARLTR